MRSYPRNSPYAAARIVALTLLADGHLSRTELDALQREDAAAALGLEVPALHDLLQDVTHDLLATGAGPWEGVGVLDEAIVAAVLAEVDDPALRRQVLALCLALAQSDRHLSEGEQAVLSAIARYWALEAATVA